MTIEYKKVFPELDKAIQEIDESIRIGHGVPPDEWLNAILEIRKILEQVKI